MTAPHATPTSLPANPFATRFTQPGALPPCDASGMPIDVAAMAARLPSAGGALAIVAPHGHGKTTLLVAMLGELAAAGRPTILRRIGSWGDAWRLLVTVGFGGGGTVIGVDGWDALAKPARAAIRVLAGLRGQTLIVTAHAPCGLAELARPQTSAALLSALVGRLPAHAGVIEAADIDEAFLRHGGNLRDALFDLYDRFERRIR